MTVAVNRLKKALRVYRGSIAALRANSQHFLFTPYGGHIVASHQLTRRVSTEFSIRFRVGFDLNFGHIFASH
jgi:hypothetical protein